MLLIDSYKAKMAVANLMTDICSDKSNLTDFGKDNNAFIANAINICSEIADRIAKLPALDTQRASAAEIVTFITEDENHE